MSFMSKINFLKPFKMYCITIAYSLFMAEVIHSKENKERKKKERKKKEERKKERKT